MSIERRYSLIKHQHDDRYSLVGHTHDLADLTGDFSDIEGGLITLESGSPTLRFSETGVTANNGKYDITVDGEDLKIRLINDALNSAVDVVVFNRTANNSDAIRIDTDIVHLDNAYLAITDALAAPGTIAGLAILYVDTADGDLKVKFGDGTTKVLASDTAVSWTAPTFQNSWTDYADSVAAGWEEAGYHKDHLGWVHIRGLIVGGTAVGGVSTLFTLPSGFRPANNLIFPAVQSDGTGATLGDVARIDVHANGNVIVQNLVVNSDADRWLSISGVRFYADGS